MSNLPIQPRILRASEAPKYLGMCRAVFDQTVRPYVNEFPIGTRGVGFDRLELDQWADAYILANSITKHKTAELPELGVAPPQSKRKKRGPVLAGSPTSKPYQSATAENFYKLLAEIMGKAAPKDRRKKQESQRPQNEE